VSCISVLDQYASPPPVYRASKCVQSSRAQDPLGGCSAPPSTCCQVAWKIGFPVASRGKKRETCFSFFPATSYESTQHGPNGVFPWNGRLHTTKETWHARIRPCHVFNSTFWDLSLELCINSIRARQGSFLYVRFVHHSNWTATANIVVFPTIAYIFVLCANQTFESH